MEKPSDGERREATIEQWMRDQRKRNPNSNQKQQLEEFIASLSSVSARLKKDRVKEQAQEHAQQRLHDLSAFFGNAEESETRGNIVEECPALFMWAQNVHYNLDRYNALTPQQQRRFDGLRAKLFQSVRQSSPAREQSANLRNVLIERRIALHQDQNEEEIYDRSSWRDLGISCATRLESAVIAEMESALRAGIAKYVGLLGRMGSQTMVSGAIFPFVNAWPEVQLVLRNNLLQHGKHIC